MKSREQLQNAIIKSATNKDETKYLLSLIDAVISEEIEAQDALLLAEIEDLTEFSNKLIHVTNAQANEISRQEDKVSELEKRERDLNNAFATGKPPKQ